MSRVDDRRRLSLLAEGLEQQIKALDADIAADTAKGRKPALRKYSIRNRLANSLMKALERIEEMRVRRRVRTPRPPRESLS